MAARRTSPSSDPKSEAKKPLSMAGRWGQVMTPQAIAVKMAGRLLQGRPNGGVRILDPCVGASTFPMALSCAGVLRMADELALLDVDPVMLRQSCGWVRDQGIKFSAECADYIETDLEPRYVYAGCFVP